MKNLDDISYFVKTATDILFVKNPVSTSMGTLFGLIMHGTFNGLSVIFQSLSLLKLNVAHFLATGIFIFNLPNYFSRHKISPKIEAAMKMIKEQRAQGLITDEEAKIHYKELVSQAVADAKIREVNKPESSRE